MYSTPPNQLGWTLWGAYIKVYIIFNFNFLLLVYDRCLIQLEYWSMELEQKARVSLTLSRYSSLSSITLGKSVEVPVV